MNKLESDLRSEIDGDVRFDMISKKVYSVDASIYEIEPIGIVIPKTKEDLIKAVRIAHQHHTPVIARGAATGIAGGCIGQGLIIDSSKYLNRILEINLEKEYVICEPGVIQDQLNHALIHHGYRLGPDTSTGNRATIGGMVGNNAAGARSLKYGRMVDHVEEVECILANGQTVNFHPINDSEWEKKRALNNAEGNIYRELYRIRNQYQSEIKKNFPSIPRRASGYNLDELIKIGPLNVSKLFTGSEGTLGIASQIKLRIVKISKSSGLALLFFHDMIEAMSHIPHILTFNPIAVEMIDNQIIKLGRQSPSLRGKLDWLVEKPDCLFAVEFDGDTPDEVDEKITCFLNDVDLRKIGYTLRKVLDPQVINSIWTLRKAGVGVLMSKRSYNRAIAFIEDLSVAPANLAPFMKQLSNLLKKYDKEAGIYGHVGSGCMHIRPFIDLRQPEELKHMREILEAVSTLVLEYGGAMSGEHGDGIVRSWLNKKMFGDQLYQAFVDVKEAFDPDNLMNPGKIVYPSDPFVNLRLSPITQQIKVPTFLDFSAEGGFELAVDMCNGNGLCRKADGTMCPSFQVTRDEYDSTRARAQVLRSLVNGKLDIKDHSSNGVKQILDLCIECKGCKTECPSQVDMAKMKSEFLFQYQKHHGVTFRERLFAHIGWINLVPRLFVRPFNFLRQTLFIKTLLQLIGITPERVLPALAHQRFSDWFKDYSQPINLSKSVAIFNDTYCEFQEPHVGQAAVKVLNKLGYHVTLIPWTCCGRPMIAKGFLKEAKAKAQKLLDVLSPIAESGSRIIGLEPSCILTVKDDFGSLLPDNPKLSSVRNACTTFDEFLNELIHKGEFYLPKNDANVSHIVKVHGHCHQKAIVGIIPTLNVLKAIPGFEVSEIPSGCCGMAGSFGYESEHYDFSMKIGNLKLFPTLKDAPKKTIVVADGISCRTQIAHGTDRKAKHLAEVIWEAFHSGTKSEDTH